MWKIAKDQKAWSLFFQGPYTQLFEEEHEPEHGKGDQVCPWKPWRGAICISLSDRLAIQLQGVQLTVALWDSTSALERRCCCSQPMSEHGEGTPTLPHLPNTGLPAEQRALGLIAAFQICTAVWGSFCPLPLPPLYLSSCLTSINLLNFQPWHPLPRGPNRHIVLLLTLSPVFGRAWGTVGLPQYLLNRRLNRERERVMFWAKGFLWAPMGTSTHVLAPLSQTSGTFVIGKHLLNISSPRGTIIPFFLLKWQSSFCGWRIFTHSFI